MKPTLNEKFIAYLALLSGLSISAVAVYYSVVGLTAIFAGAVIPIVIMGTSLEVSKLIATVWLKQNWSITPKLVKAYLLAAIAVLMVITSMGIFGFLSKAHLDQGVSGGEVAAKIALLDEKIKTAKDNIEVNRKALKQMDEAVDQSMARSTSETGADKAVAIRKSQAKERTRLQSEIAAEQKTVNALNEERAPIAAEVRKVEAEVGPIKYIAAFFYGATDTTVLEKAVTWVIIILIVVFDPLAVMLLLASQISFQNFRKREQEISDAVEEEMNKPDAWVADVGEPPTAEELEEIEQFEEPEETVPAEPVHAYLKNNKSFYSKPYGWTSVGPLVHIPKAEPEKATLPIVDEEFFEIEEVQGIEPIPQKSFNLESYVQNEEQGESNLWTVMNHEEFIAASQEDRDSHIAEIVAKVKARTMKMTDVPELLQNDVKARV